MIGRWWRGAGCEVLDVPHKVGGACSAVKGSEGSVGTRKVRVCGIGHTRGLVEGSVVCLVCGGVVIPRRFLGSPPLWLGLYLTHTAQPHWIGNSSPSQRTARDKRLSL